MKAKKFTVLLIAVCVITLILSTVVSCKTEDSGSATVEDTKQEEKVKDEEKIEEETVEEKSSTGQVIHVLLEDTPWHRNIENTVGVFEEATGIKVEMEFMPETQSREKVELDLMTGTGTYDVFLVDDLYIWKYAKLGSLLALDDFIAADSDFDIETYMPAALDIYTVDGKLYGVPFAMGMDILAYRKDFLEKYDAKVPNTYEELLESALKVQEGFRADGIDDIYGFTARGIRGEGLNMWIIGSSIFPAFGGKWFDQDTGVPTINSPEMVAGLEYYVNILQQAGPPDAAAHSWDDCYNVMREGKAAFHLECPTLFTIIKGDGGEVGENIGFTLVPAGPDGTRHPGAYAIGYAISANSKDVDASWEFLKFATTYEQMISDATTGGNYCSASEKVFNSPEFQERYPFDELNNTVVESSKISKLERPVILRRPEVGDILSIAAQSAIAGEMSAQEALDEAQALVMEIYEEDPEGVKE